MIQLEHAQLRARIERLAAGAQRKIAAVACVSDDSHIKFGAGDTLIVDASTEQIASGACSARVLADALNRGAKVYSLPRLHATLMVLDNTVVSSSANLSDVPSTPLKEIGIISDDAPLVRDALLALDNLAKQAQPVDKRFVERLRKVKRATGQAKRKRRQAKSRPPAAGKLTFMEALQASSPLLGDFVFMMTEGKASLTDRRIKAGAKKKGSQLPPPDKWAWFEYDADGYPGELLKLFVEQGFKILSLTVESDEDSIQRAVALSPYCLVYVNHVRIGDKIVINCIKDKRTPFKLGVRIAKTFCTSLTAALQADPKLGKKLFKSRGWVFKPREIVHIIR
jgi:hypothetical protein